VSHGEVVGVPVRITDDLEIGTDETVEPRRTEPVAVLRAEIHGVLRNERRLIADVRRRAVGLLDFAVGPAEARIQVETVDRPGVDLRFEPLVVHAPEVAEVLRARIRVEDEEVRAFGLGRVCGEGEPRTAVRQLALEAGLDGVGRLLVEEVVDSRDTRGADTGLVEPAAAETAAVAGK